MVDPATRLPVKTDEKMPPAPTAAPWPPVDDLRREIDRLFEDFTGGAWLRPFRAASHKLQPTFRSGFAFAAPAVDVVEKDTAFELTAELPGITSKDIDVSMKDGNIVIKGQKEAEKEEKSKDYYLHERQFGSFERAFTIPDGVEADKIEASFGKGVLTLTLPKSAAAQQPEKKITVKAT